MHIVINFPIAFAHYACIISMVIRDSPTALCSRCLFSIMFTELGLSRIQRWRNIHDARSELGYYNYTIVESESKNTVMRKPKGSKFKLSSI